MRNINCYLWITYVLLQHLLWNVGGQYFINQPPHFLVGTGDMSRFSLPENTEVGSPVYQLKGMEKKFHVEI